MADSETRSSLLIRLRDLADADAWRTFVNVYAPLIYGHCRRQGLQEADVADVTQEVLTQVASSIRRFEYQPEKGRFRDWLGAVVRSKVGRFRHRQARLGQGGPAAEVALEEAADPGSDVGWSDEFYGHLLRVALERIRPDFEEATWRAFQRAWLDEVPAAEVARELNVAPSLVYVAKSRVLKRLREEVLLLAEDMPQLAPLP